MPPRRKPTLDPAAVAARLRELVAADGRTLQAIADAAGMHRPNLHEILHGTRDPRLSTLAAILRALGKSWRDLDPPPVSRSRPGTEAHRPAN